MEGWEGDGGEEEGEMSAINGPHDMTVTIRSGLITIMWPTASRNPDRRWMGVEIELQDNPWLMTFQAKRLIRFIEKYPMRSRL